MNRCFLGPIGTHAEKNGCRISFLKHDLASTLTLPTPLNSLLAGRCS
jgi:hypothetical protein